MEIIKNIYIDLSFNLQSYELNATGYVNNAITYNWYEITNGQNTYLTNTSSYIISNNFLYSDRDLLKIYKCIIDNTKVVNFYVIYKSFFSESIEYSIKLKGNPLLLDISYTAYTLEYNALQTLNAGNATGGIQPYQYTWYDGTTLISNATGSIYTIQHLFNNVEPALDIYKTYYCEIRNAGYITPVKTIQFDIIFKNQPIALSATQNVTDVYLAQDESTTLKLINIIGGRKPLQIIWEKENYPGAGQFSVIKTSSVPSGILEDSLQITNYRESFDNAIVLTYKATITDSLRTSLPSFNFTVNYDKYYLAIPCFPAGTIIKAYDSNNQLVDVAVENLQIGQWIPSNDNVRVKIKNIYTKTDIISSGEIYTLTPTVKLYKSALISTDAYKYYYINNVNNVNNSLNGQVVILYHIETPNYLKYDILVDNYYIKSYGNQTASMRYDKYIDAYITSIPSIDFPMENPDDVEIL